ncbi:YbhB/YbcL family Raf kinase inhibitor-like protein [Methylocella silvestris]|uniref:YbhB/YbcL family Raf kinase inhibitor-like protein n=1 Tax=Methylocella silvestris TaxID=199596 RepID=A0A2J7TCU2_METSI|nr:YbhB/YbcL family Raf kinase inhibitor-like protein [Methylocella silvestris]PNG24590.1 YbhB/YbcL family Raf kinase inhibitor-like protein [Methylocella silvestris]
MLGKQPAGHGHLRANGAEESAPWLDALIYAEAGPDIPETIRVASVAFEDGEAIPPLFSALGEGESPPLRWRGVPDGAASIVLVVEDADSKTPEPFLHAIAVKTPGMDDDLIPGALCPENAFTEGLLLGVNSRGATSWTPPDPPPGHGAHRYVFQVYAVDRRPDFDAPPGRAEIIRFLQSRAIAKGRLTGIFERSA